MNERDAMWAACLAEPNDDARRGALADMLQADGYESLASAIRGVPGRGLALIAADRPAGNFLLQLHAMTGGERVAAVGELIFETRDRWQHLGEFTESGLPEHDVDIADVRSVSLGDRGCEAHVGYWDSVNEDQGVVHFGIGPDAEVRVHGVHPVDVEWEPDADE